MRHIVILLFMPLSAFALTDNVYDLSIEQLQQVKVYSASRLSQTLSEAPNAMTVIDRKTIEASGLRSIPDLFKLVPGMYVSYYKGSQAIVAYHGATDAASRRMQVMLDGRSIYLPPANTVDWANLPVTIDDIARIEVIRGPAAASYGANSTQGVINIITKDAREVNGKTVEFTHGTKGINDASAYFGKRAETFDYRMTLAYSADNGYDNLVASPNNLPPDPTLFNNSNDSNQARLLNFRGNYHPNSTDSIELQLGFKHDLQGVGFNDKNPSVFNSNPRSTNGNPFHDLIANSGFMQLGWTHLLENASELNLRYFHVQENQHEALPVYLYGIYFPGPTVQTLATGRDQIEVQHTLSTSGSNRLVYGANYQRSSVNGQNVVPPLSLNLSTSSLTNNLQVFANDEWRFNPRLLLNIGGMFEREDFGHQNLSPRVSLNFHMTPLQTFRAGVSVAYRTPSLAEKAPAILPGTLGLIGTTISAPNLKPERLVSREIAYIGEFPEWEALLDVRLFSDQLSNGIMPDSTTLTFVNGFTAEYHGFEATLKKSWGEADNLTVNFAHELANSNGAALAAGGDQFFVSSSPSANDILTASIPTNSASLLYSRRLGSDYSCSTSYYYQASSYPFGRASKDHQPAQHRMDARIARQFRDIGGMKGEVALVVQNLFKTDYTEYIVSNLFNRRAYIMLKLNW